MSSIKKTKPETFTTLEREIRRLQIKNLKLKMHMQVLVSHPLNSASAKVRSQYNGKEEAENMFVVPLN
jgi:hypothetical protein